MYKIGLVGHKSEDLASLTESNKILENTIDLLSYQYGKDTIINIGGGRGLELDAGIYCLKSGLKYHLFLPAEPKIFADNSWYDEQKEQLEALYKNAAAVTIYFPIKYDKQESYATDHLLIDHSGFVIAFWVGKKIGRTYDIVKYALQQNKLVLNAYNELKLITNKDLEKQ